MKLKRLIATLLVVATLCGLTAVVPASAASGRASAFTDISDPQVAGAAEILRLLGVVNGTGGSSFNPSGTLTRAEFCKMAVEVMGKGNEAAAQANRTIFKDVKGGNWASGYINLAASTPIGAAGEEGGSSDMLMMGKGDATFGPGDVITFAQAVTVMMRILGYGAKDIATGSSWYGGYLATANTIGLTEGVSLSWDSPITRGQTAILFENMLYTKPNGGKDPYLTTLGGKILDEAIILSVDATTADNTTGAIQTIAGETVSVYKTDHVPFDASLCGVRAKLVLDKEEKVIAITPSTSGSQRTVTVVAPEINYLTVSGGEKLDVPTETPVYQDGAMKLYKDIYINLKAGVQVNFHYSATGKLEYLFIPTADTAETAAVAKATGSGNPFSSLVGGDTGYRIVKNGVTASIADIRQYDVATYDKTTKTLHVSDLRLTGVYENVSPSPATPLSVTVLGATLPVLSSAYEDLARFKIGDIVTLLLTADGQVAGAVSSSEAKSTTVGVVKMDGKYAVVTPLMDLRGPDGEKITLKGETNLSDTSAAKMQGQLVTVSSSKVNQITLSRLSGSGASGTLDVNKRTLGGEALADNVYLYERVGNGAPASITFSQLTRATVPSSKISYVGKDYAGRINIIVFDDVTGDQYTYGIAETGEVSGGSFGEETIVNASVKVNSGGTDSEMLITGANIKNGSFIGIAASLDTVNKSNHKLANWVELKSVAGVSRADFELNGVTPGKDNPTTPIGTVTTSNKIIPIAGNVACYNRTTKKWFASLDEARAYSNSLTIYYDRTPEEGGKVRLIVVE